MPIIDSITTLLKGRKHKYLRSSHRKDYEEIARTYYSSPDRVYLLAHNTSKALYHEHIILEALRERGIIHYT